MSFQLKAQLILSYSVGYGTYDMEQMKDALEYANHSINHDFGELDLYKKDHFSGQITHSIELGGKAGKGELGINGSIYTADGKLSYADYSGFLDYKLLSTGLRLGLFLRGHFYRIPVGNHSSFSIYGELSPGIIFSRLEERMTIGIYNPNNGQLTKDTSNDLADYKCFSIMPKVGVRYSINEWLGINLQSGYDWYPDYEGLKKMEDPTNWSGFRISGGVSLILK
jgi:hypothetical protein